MVTGDQPDPDPADNVGNASIVVPPQADLSITKTASAASVPAGGTLTYTLVVTNAGPNDAPGVVVDDALPASLTATATSASQGTCTIATGDVRCALGTLASGGQAQVLITTRVAASAGGTTVVNTASVASAITDLRPTNNQSSASTTITTLSPAGGPLLAITKRVNRTHATTADLLTYVIEVDNLGTAAATALVVTDTFGRPVVVESVKTTAGTCSRRPLSCRIASLGAGAQVKITIVARPTTAGTLTNGASVTAADAAGAAASPST